MDKTGGEEASRRGKSRCKGPEVGESVLSKKSIKDAKKEGEQGERLKAEGLVAGGQGSGFRSRYW